MSEPIQTPSNPTATGFPADASLEEREAAQFANDAEALGRAELEVGDLKAKNADLAEQYLRAQAEMQNTRRRAEEEISKARKFAVDSFAESLLPVADSLEAALLIKDASPEQMKDGAQATLRQLKSALERNKVVEINPATGTRFDPHQHQAISVVPAATSVTGAAGAAGAVQEPNTVVNVLQKGYLIADRVLRPALVSVSAPA